MFVKGEWQRETRLGAAGGGPGTQVPSREEAAACLAGRLLRQAEAAALPAGGEGG